ncbi:MAG: aminotransferase class V-fold PLP-dependent enzyme, partial [Bacteroidales bacterium]|nr:aminotransferase class V-fold PLP-dependent enzyme [Bacteroidales bacterium]
MKKVHVFNAGPCLLPQVAIDNAIEAMKDFSGTGMSVLCISHRTKEWDAVMDECRSLWKELLHIPDTHEVVFLGGGASLQFLYVAMNFLEKKAAYLDTGVWASKALKEAKGIGDAYAIASSKDKNYTYIPKGFEIPADLDYLHITTNNTIYGTEIHEDLDVPCPLIADMSSDIMSRPVDVSKYDLIYGGA